MITIIGKWIDSLCATILSTKKGVISFFPAVLKPCCSRKCFVRASYGSWMTKKHLKQVKLLFLCTTTGMVFKERSTKKCTANNFLAKNNTCYKITTCCGLCLIRYLPQHTIDKSLKLFFTNICIKKHNCIKKKLFSDP